MPSPISSSPTASPTASSPWGRPYHRQSPQDTLSPSTSRTPALHKTYFSQILFPEVFLFPSEHPPGAPYSSRQSTLCTPSACLEATHRRTRPPPSQYPRHTQHRHPEPLWPRRRPRGTKGWDLTQERPSGPGARGCRSEPALSMSTTGENLHLCGADNRRRRLFPKVHSRKHVI